MDIQCFLSNSREPRQVVLCMRNGKSEGRIAGRSARAGFTLVEVLIASLILFSAIAVGSVAMRTAMSHLDRVSAHTRAASTLYLVKDVVKAEIQQGRLEGRGEWGEEVAYEWKARALRNSRNVLGPKPSGDGVAVGGFELTLCRVTLTLWPKDASPPEPRSYEYQELIHRDAS